MKKILYISLLLVSILSCRPPEKLVKKCNNENIKFLYNEDYEKATNAISQILILNEGGYTYGNASISGWNVGGGNIQNIFETKNGYKIGDVLQSAYSEDGIDSELYLIVNNSQKIEVVDKNSLERIKTITGFTSPRYMTTIGDIALVTDLYANKISIFKTSYTECELPAIKMKGWTEQIFAINNKIYVIERSEVGASTLFANLVEIDIDFTDEENTKFTISKRTSLPIEPQSVVLDFQKNIWILSSGKESENVYPTITKYNTNTNTIEKSFAYNSFSNIPQNLCYSNSGFYYNIASDIYFVEENANEFPTTKAFTSVAENIYNLSYDGENDLLIICDAKDYVSEGTVLAYKLDGELYQTIPAGVIPNAIVF